MTDTLMKILGAGKPLDIYGIRFYVRPLNLNEMAEIQTEFGDLGEALGDMKTAKKIIAKKLAKSTVELPEGMTEAEFPEITPELIGELIDLSNFTKVMEVIGDTTTSPLAIPTVEVEEGEADKI